MTTNMTYVVETADSIFGTFVVIWSSSYYTIVDPMQEKLVFNMQKPPIQSWTSGTNAAIVS